ncbi:MAG: hypothetical protein AB7G28_16910 [Pirellulales bacterium]
MSATMRLVFWSLCLIVGLMNGPVEAAESIRGAIPADALGFAAVHNLAEAMQRFGDVAKLVGAPAPDLLSLLKDKSGLGQGLDDQGDLAIVLVSFDAAPRAVLLVPVANFEKFFAALGAKEPAAGIVEVQLAGSPALVGRKGNYASIALSTDRAALEQLLASTDSLANNSSLGWLDENQASIVVTPPGVKQLVPKIIGGIQQMQASMRQMPGDQGKFAADAFNLYLRLFTAAETEVQQFSLALGIGSDQSVSLSKRVQFTPGGAWATWAAGVESAEQDLLSGLPAGPFVMAISGVVPPGSIEQMMQFSVQMMQEQPMYKLTPEQAQRYADLSLQAMRGVRSMKMLIGVAEPGAGFYGNTTAIMTFDDAAKFLTEYEKTLVEMRKFSEEVKSPMIPAATVEHVPFDGAEALAVTMDMSQIGQVTTPGAPNQQKIMQAMVGSSGKMTVYIAAADEHAVVMSYTSLERLKAAIDFYRSQQPGLAADAGVAKVAAALPPGAQMIGFIQLDGITSAVRRFTPIPAMIPDFPASSPIGFAAKASPSGVEGQLFVAADTLRAIGETVAKVRNSLPAGGSPQK